jgi:radical SAM protein with 4Fe4S-binding SPASM domain
MPEKIKYDERGGIISLENKISQPESIPAFKHQSYNLFERLLLRFSKRVNYLLDGEGKYKCRNEKTPSVIRIGPTNRCTAQCSYCPREHIHAKGSGYMDFGMYEEIILWAEKNKVKEISFALFGEPLLHPQILEMFALAKSKNFDLRLSTNAIIMNDAMANSILEIGFKVIEMSFDGCTPLEYESGKRVPAYEQAKKNIRYLLDKAREKEVKTKFNIHFVDAGNVSAKSKNEFISYWKNEFRGLNYETGFYYEPHNWAGTRNEVRKKMPLVDRILSKLEFKKPCVYIKGLNIDWNGNAIICTNDPTEKAIIGNIKDAKIEEIYNGEKRIKYLDAHEKGDFRTLNCAVCTVNSYWPLLYIKKKILIAFK